ncbi:hypothetical protein I6F26_29050 [Ensifer sp. IC3342]|nr:hypothetical protein [Ensifer sp. BRP08]MCA1450590.1 hypothetical protein [Ensifer sp. IC3342]
MFPLVEGPTAPRGFGSIGREAAIGVLAWAQAIIAWPAEILLRELHMYRPDFHLFEDAKEAMLFKLAHSGA